MIVIPFVAMPLGATLVFPLTDALTIAVSIANVLCRPNENKGRRQLDPSLRLMARGVPLAARLEQEPGPSLSFVDPNLDQAGSRDVAVFLAHVVGFP